ncbi:hypothetical protein ACFCXR_23855 [Streptomyces noursei]|uniref:hypothetical protein n=1 Tax=Streptomyces noursei TaxID=1971 RepID=UPI0035D86589
MTTQTALACTLAPHGTANALRLTLANPNGEPVTCTRITLHRQAAFADGPLPADETTPTTAEGSDGAGWELNSDSPGRYDLRPRQPATLAPGGRLDIVLTGLRPVHGSARIEITPHTPHPAPQPAPFNVTGPTSTITNFWAEPPNVEKPGDPFTLHWTATAPKPDLTYEICYGNGTRVPVNDTMHGGDNGTWSCPEGIKATTTFALIATSTTHNTTNVSDVRTVAVGVSIPDLTTGALTADGTVSLFSAPVALLPETSREKPAEVAATATTDGLIAACLKPGTASKGAYMRITVTTSNGVTHRAEALAPGGSGPRNLLTPVPNGAKLAIHAATSKGPFTIQATWYPMGHAPLKTT